ncbi:MAG: septal ring lytic transglycosylase RlpA family protein [Myxococcota bacterium]
MSDLLFGRYSAMHRTSRSTRFLFSVGLLLFWGCGTTSSSGARSSATVPSSVIEGRASYYHDSLAGNCTANGEHYDPRKRTAASRELPFGTVARVVRKDTGATVVVRFNDRGPFGRDRSRIVDLSRRAAEELDMIRAGVVPIRLEILKVGDGARHRCTP